jgi:hypothetical protein
MGGPGEAWEPLLAKIEALLKCPICLNSVQLPVNLTCFPGCAGARAQLLMRMPTHA